MFTGKTEKEALVIALKEISRLRKGMRKVQDFIAQDDEHSYDYSLTKRIYITKIESVLKKG